jgi:peptidylprolyl isomerase
LSFNRVPFFLATETEAMPVLSSRILRAASYVLVTAAFAATCIVGCSRLGDNSTLGKAGKTEVSAADVRSMLADLPESSRDAVMKDKVALERIVRAELVRRSILREAKDAHFESDAATQKELDRVRDDTLVRLWVAKQGQVSKDYPSEEDLRLAFQSNQSALAAPTQYRVAQIFVSAPNGISADRLAVAMRKAAEVGAKIPGGDFAALAREYSEHAESAAKGGDVGLLPADRMLPEVVAAVRNIDVGSTVGPVKTSQGLHYVKLLERKDGEPATLDASRARLTEALRSQRAQELQQAYLQSLNAKLNVSVDQIAIGQLNGTK